MGPHGLLRTARPARHPTAGDPALHNVWVDAPDCSQSRIASPNPAGVKQCNVPNKPNICGVQNQLSDNLEEIQMNRNPAPQTVRGHPP